MRKNQVYAFPVYRRSKQADRGRKPKKPRSEERGFDCVLYHKIRTMQFQIQVVNSTLGCGFLILKMDWAKNLIFFTSS